MLFSSKMSHRKAYWEIYPAYSMPNIIFILSLEDQSPVCVVFLSRTIQLSVHIGALENAAILIRVNTLALQGVVHIVALQGAVRQGSTQAVVRP